MWAGSCETNSRPASYGGRSGYIFRTNCATPWERRPGITALTVTSVLSSIRRGFGRSRVPWGFGRTIVRHLGRGIDGGFTRDEDDPPRFPAQHLRQVMTGEANTAEDVHPRISAATIRRSPRKIPPARKCLLFTRMSISGKRSSVVSAPASWPLSATRARARLPD